MTISATVPISATTIRNTRITTTGTATRIARGTTGWKPTTATITIGPRPTNANSATTGSGATSIPTGTKPVQVSGTRLRPVGRPVAIYLPRSLEGGTTPLSRMYTEM